MMVDHQDRTALPFHFMPNKIINLHDNFITFWFIQNNCFRNTHTHKAE